MSRRPAVAGLVRLLGLAFLGLFATIPAANAQLLPADFLSSVPQPGQGAAEIEADLLSYDGRLDVISAEGGVVMRYAGFTLAADRLIYNQQTGELRAVGNVLMTDTGGNTYKMDSLDVTGGMKEAFLKSLTLTTVDGATITAADVAYSGELQTILTDAAYSPCGLCIDSKGRRIGWRVKAARMIYDRANGSVILEQPALELLGYQVAWLPWFWFPDPTQPRKQGLRFPAIDFDDERGVSLTVPYFIPAGPDTDILLSPMLMSRQGLLVAADVTHRFPGFGEINVKASGLYQLDKMAFSFVDAQRDWRGAIQTSGRFTPAEDWVVGWSYATFTDNAYLSDYELSDADSSVNEVYATYLSTDTFFDARIQRFNRLGNYSASDDAQQGMTLPWIRFNDVYELGPGNGRVNLSLDLLGVHRLNDQTAVYNGVPYVFGYEGNKVHLKAEGAWETQWILPMGVTATPYLGARIDASSYDGASSYPGAPGATSLLSVTPIASMDFRWPLIAQDGLDSHLFEPIAQIVYRGSSTTGVGITNDNAQSFVFDDSNLFSMNRFSGTDRQETGLRVNLGAHYLGNFANGGWLDLVAGQSFHLAGLNALGVSDDVNVGTSTGLGGMASSFVAGGRGGYGPFTGAGKIQLDTTFHVRRAGLGASYGANGYSASLSYQFIAATPPLGIVEDEHELTLGAGVLIVDYWSANSAIDFDLAAGTWTEVRAGVAYDDGFLTYGLNGNVTPTSYGFGLTFGLKGPDGKAVY